jgi:hypothetical protein
MFISFARIFLISGSGFFKLRPRLGMLPLICHMLLDHQCLSELCGDSVKTCNNAETRQRNQTNAELMLCTIIVQMNPYTKTLHTATIIVNKKLYDIHDIYCRKRYLIFGFETIPKFCIFMFISFARIFLISGSGFFKLRPRLGMLPLKFIKCLIFWCFIISKPSHVTYHLSFTDLFTFTIFAKFP